MNHRPETQALLQEAFDQFTRASGSLEAAYGGLRQRAEQLSIELEAANRELRRSLHEEERVRQYLTAILESLPCGVVVVDRQGTVTVCNARATRLLSMSEAGEGATSYRARLGPHPLAEPMAACLRDPSLRLSELELQDGPQAPVLAVSSSPVGRSSGAWSGVVFIIKDVTPIKRLEAQTRRAERLSAMGEMAVELAHEIRNPLAGIELFASLLCEELPPAGPPAAWAGQIRVGVRSLNTILSNMLNFTRDLTPDRRPVDLQALLEETLRFAAPLLEARGVTLARAYGAASPVAAGDGELLKQVFLNLIFNALQAMPESGRLEVATGRRDGPAAGDGPWLEVRFRDTGIGIDPARLDQIFDPHYTTTCTGSGLGLAVVHRVVEAHGGRIRVESAVNAGATFTILLPPAAGSGVAATGVLCASHTGSR